ncbi:MAG: transposase [Euryarchaeota archaeon]|nr:transposase [Euryarchaeota archaeon]
MGEVEAKRDRVTRHDLRHDRHTVSLLTDHLVFSPKYRGNVLDGEVAEATEEIIRETCKEFDIEVITNFLEENIKNEKAKSFYISRINA